MGSVTVRARCDVRPMAPGDYQAAVGGPGWAIAGRYSPRPQDVEASFLARGPAFSGWIDGQLAGVAGVVIPWPTLGDAWIVLTEHGRRHRRLAWLAIREGFRRLLLEHPQLARIQAWIEAGNPAAVTLAEHLGFRPEARLPHYGPRGETFLLCALFPQREEGEA